MKTVIIYASHHHGNTEKLVKAISEKYSIEMINAEKESLDISEYDCIGFASGIDFGKFYDCVQKEAEKYMTAGKRVFFIYTCGQNNKDFSEKLKAIAKERGCEVCGSFGCTGYNTYGPWKLIGGINRKHPNEQDITNCIRFFEENVSKRVKNE